MQPDRSQVVELLKNPILRAWIDDYQTANAFAFEKKGKKYPNCRDCGWPHNVHTRCGMGATFGSVRLGGDSYYIDASNVEFMLGFVTKLSENGFHWKNGIYFDVRDGNVVVTSLWQFNGHPQVRRWTIPLREWQSITGFVQTRSAISMAS